MTKFSKGIDSYPLPKQFDFKLVTNLNASPAEFADALFEETVRPQWEPKLT